MTNIENNVAAQTGAAPIYCTCPSGDGSLCWPCPQHPPELDVVVEANRALLHSRSQLGIKKYGGTLDTMRHSRRSLLQHALEEALDLANYLQADIQAIDREAAQVSPRATANVERDVKRQAERVERLVRAAKVYTFNYLQDEHEEAELCTCGPKQHAELVELFAALAAIATTKPGA